MPGRGFADFATALAGGSIAEKGFSLGYFDRAYLQRGACAVVRRDGSIVAFANIWVSAELEECSIDLMRHTRDAPTGYGELFYNFEGLRKYKEKFQPEWQSRYLAAPGGVALPRILFDASRLISGGVMRIVTRPVGVAR